MDGAAAPEAVMGQNGKGIERAGAILCWHPPYKKSTVRPTGLIPKGNRTGCLPQLVFLRVHLDHLLSIARVGLSLTPGFETRTRPIKDRWLVPPIRQY